MNEGYTIDMSGSTGTQFYAIKPQELSEWNCYLFGNRPGGTGITYRPGKGQEPNWFARWMMLVFFDCLWVKEQA